MPVHRMVFMLAAVLSSCAVAAAMPMVDFPLVNNWCSETWEVYASVSLRDNAGLSDAGGTPCFSEHGHSHSVRVFKEWGDIRSQPSQLNAQVVMSQFTVPEPLPAGLLAAGMLPALLRRRR